MQNFAAYRTCAVRRLPFECPLALPFPMAAIGISSTPLARSQRLLAGCFRDRGKRHRELDRITRHTLQTFVDRLHDDLRLLPRHDPSDRNHWIDRARREQVSGLDLDQDYALAITWFSRAAVRNDLS
jgi:hypothetical protein